MLARSSTMLARQCSCLPSLSTSTTARAVGIKGTAVVNQRGEHPTKVSARSFSGTNDDGREFSSMPPHHLARKNNGMVNGLVKSTKVPRPIAVAMPPHPTRSRNQLKERVVLVIPEMADGEQQSHISYVGNDSMPITTELKIVLPEDDVPRGTWPVFRMMVSEGGSRYLWFRVNSHLRSLALSSLSLGGSS